MSVPGGGPSQRIHMDRLSLFCLRVLVIGLLGYGIVLAWSKLSLVLLPFAIAILLAALLSPVARFLVRRARIPVVPAALLTVVGTLAIIIGALVWIVPAIVQQGSDLVSQVQDGVKQIPSLLHDAGVKDADIQKYTREATNKLEDALGTIGPSVGTGVFVAFSGVVSALTTALLAVMMLIYMLVDGAGFWRGVLKFAPEGRRESWGQGGARAWRALTVFIHSQVLVALIDGVGIGLGLAILGVPLAVPIGVLTFLLAFLPYIGAILAGIAAMLVALSTQGPGGAAAVFGLVLLVQQVEGNILYPLLIGRSLRLHPLMVLLGVGAGGALLGITGSFLATPVVAAVGAALGWIGVEEDEDAIAASIDPDDPVPEEELDPDDPEDVLGRAGDGAASGPGAPD